MPMAAICQKLLLSLVKLAEASPDSLIPVLITNINSQITHTPSHSKYLHVRVSMWVVK